MVSNQSYNKLAYMHSEQARQLLAHSYNNKPLLEKGLGGDSSSKREQDGRKYSVQLFLEQ